MCVGAGRRRGRRRRDQSDRHRRSNGDGRHSMKQNYCVLTAVENAAWMSRTGCSRLWIAREPPRIAGVARPARRRRPTTNATARIPREAATKHRDDRNVTRYRRETTASPHRATAASDVRESRMIDSVSTTFVKPPSSSRRSGCKSRSPSPRWCKPIPHCQRLVAVRVGSEEANRRRRKRPPGAAEPKPCPRSPSTAADPDAQSDSGPQAAEADECSGPRRAASPRRSRAAKCMLSKAEEELRARRLRTDDDCKGPAGGAGTRSQLPRLVPSAKAAAAVGVAPRFFAS